MDEHRPDQIAGAEHVFGDELTGPGVAPVAAQPVVGYGARGGR